MTNKEQIFKIIEEKTDAMQALAVESIELIYNAGYNEEIEAAAKYNDDNCGTAKYIRSLKK